ncbi:MAG: peptidylprolyl isomerase [Breznakibacter sp.]
MATLERIRNRAGILVASFIGLALLAFILNDLLGSGQKVFGGSNQRVAKIDGESVSIQEYQNQIAEFEDYAKLSSGRSSLDETTAMRLREQVWNQLVQKIVMDKKYEQIGIEVTPDEILDMVAGKNVHPSIRQMFTNPQTGVFDQAQVINFLQNKNQDPQANFYWSFLEKQLKAERLFTKYASLVKGGMYVTSSQAKMEAEAKSKEVDFNFVVVRYNTVSDSLIKVASSDIKNYYNKNKENFKSEATRDIEYVSFTVTPTEEDKQTTFEWVNKQKEAFANPATDAIQFVQMNSETPADGRYLKPEQLSSDLQRFVTSAAVNDVYGPYLENESYKLSRLVDIKQLPDSVKARHILIRNNTPERNNQLGDSLLARIKAGDDFAALARKYSEDPGSAINGGDLGWFAEGAMVKPFNDAAFMNNKGETVKVESQFGIHIIQVQDKGAAVTKYNVATLERKIDYSSKTYQNVYSQATRFAAENNSQEKFNAAITKQNLVKRYGKGIKTTDQAVGALESSRELVRWAFEASKGSLSPIYEFGDEIVMAVLTGEQEKGYAKLEDVSASISRELINEKKAEQLMADLKAKNASSLEQLAAMKSTQVESASHINFGSFQVPGAGVEPALVAAATSAPVGKLAGPVKGYNGVYMIQVTNSTPMNEVSKEMEKAQLKQQNGYKVDYQLIQTILNKTEIEDSRIKFF